MYFIGLDFPGQGPVFIGLGVRRIEFDDGLPVDFGPLHQILPGNEVDHPGAQLVGEGLDHLPFVVHLAAVADDAPQAHAPGLGELDDTFADIVGRIHGHHLAGDHDADLLGLAFPDGMANPPQTTSPKTS